MAADRRGVAALPKGRGVRRVGDGGFSCLGGPATIALACCPNRSSSLLSPTAPVVPQPTFSPRCSRPKTGARCARTSVPVISAATPCAHPTTGLYPSSRSSAGNGDSRRRDGPERSRRRPRGPTQCCYPCVRSDRRARHVHNSAKQQRARGSASSHCRLRVLLYAVASAGYGVRALSPPQSRVSR